MTAHTVTTKNGSQRRYVSDIAFSPAVKAIQKRLGSRATYAKVERGRGWKESVTPELASFIADRDSFYLGTASGEGRPYIQYRGGPPGFLKVLDDRTLARVPTRDPCVRPAIVPGARSPDCLGAAQVKIELRKP